MDAKSFKSFLAVAKLLNFGEAARRLNYSQSTISEHIRIIEAELGVKLFERLGRKVFLTAHGNKLVPYAERVVNNAEEIQRLFHRDGKIEGQITIAAIETLCVFWLPPLLKEYTAKYPEVEIKIKMGECYEFTDWLSQNIVDVAFNINDLSRHSNIRQINLFSGDVTFIIPPDNPFSARQHFSIQELENKTVIVPEQECEYRIYFDNLLRRKNINARAVIELSSLEAIKKCVKSGLGIGLMPRIAVNDELARGELASLDLTDDHIAFIGHMSFHREKWLAPALEALENLVLAKYK